MVGRGIDPYPYIKKSQNFQLKSFFRRQSRFTAPISDLRRSKAAEGIDQTQLVEAHPAAMELTERSMDCWDHVLFGKGPEKNMGNKHGENHSGEDFQKTTPRNIQ